MPQRVQPKKNPYGFHWSDYTWKKLQILLGLEEDEIAFQKVVCHVRLLELKHFTSEVLDDQRQTELFDIVKAELREKQPTFFGGVHGDRCLSFVFGVIKKVHGQRRCRFRLHKGRVSESAVPTTQTSDCGSRTGALSTSSSSLPIVRVEVNTSMYHSPKTKDNRKKMRPVVLLTRRKKCRNTTAPKSVHDAGALPQHIPQHLDSVSSNDYMGLNSRENSAAQYFDESERSASSAVPNGLRSVYSGFEVTTQGTAVHSRLSLNSDNRMGDYSRESSTAQYFAESERSASPAVPNGFRSNYPEFKMTTQNTVYSHPPSLGENVAGPSTLRSVFRAVPQVKGPREMPGPLDAPGHFHDFQLDNHSVKVSAPPTHKPQLSTFSGYPSTNYSSLPSGDYFDYFGTSSLYGPRWEPRKPDPSPSGDFRRVEKLEKAVANTPKPSLADPPSRSADHSFIPKAPKESGIAGIHRFLSKCHPPMNQHILRFVEFGCTTTEYLRGVSTWPAEQRHKLLVKILQPERGEAAPQMDIAVLENQFETYFMDDDV